MTLKLIKITFRKFKYINTLKPLAILLLFFETLIRRSANSLQISPLRFLPLKLFPPEAPTFTLAGTGLY